MNATPRTMRTTGGEDKGEERTCGCESVSFGCEQRERCSDKDLTSQNTRYSFTPSQGRTPLDKTT